MTITQDLKGTEQRVGVFLSAHHLVLYILLAVSLFAGVYLIESRIASVAESKAEAAQTALAIEKDHSAQLAALYAANQAQRDKDNAAAIAAISQIKSQTQIQIVHDKALPAPELGHRIEDLTGFKQGTISLDNSDDLIVPLPLARGIVVQLDQGVADAETVTKQEMVIKNQQGTITDQTGIIAEDKKVLQTQIDTDTKILNAEKAKSRKSKLKWFGAGVVTGFIGRQFVKL